jgi:hypothetical protein
MKRINKLVVSLCVIAILAIGSSNVFAKPNGAKQRSISGVILDLDRTARTMTVRDSSTSDTFKIQVPEGTYIKTDHQTAALVNFEQLLRGMNVRNVTVQ